MKLSDSRVEDRELEAKLDDLTKSVTGHVLDTSVACRDGSCRIGVDGPLGAATENQLDQLRERLWQDGYQLQYVTGGAQWRDEKGILIQHFVVSVDEHPDGASESLGPLQAIMSRLLSSGAVRRCRTHYPGSGALTLVLLAHSARYEVQCGGGELCGTRLADCIQAEARSLADLASPPLEEAVGKLSHTFDFTGQP